MLNIVGLILLISGVSSALLGIIGLMFIDTRFGEILCWVFLIDAIIFVYSFATSVILAIAQAMGVTI